MQQRSFPLTQIHRRAPLVRSGDVNVRADEGKEVRAIIDSVCKFCGVDPLPGAKLYAVQS
jgi:hypothetical protein